MKRILTGLVAGLVGLAFGTATFGQIGPATPPPLPQGPSESMERAEKDQMKKRSEKPEKKKRAPKRAEKDKDRAEEKK